MSYPNISSLGSILEDKNALTSEILAFLSQDFSGTDYSRRVEMIKDIREKLVSETFSVFSRGDDWRDQPASTRLIYCLFFLQFLVLFLGMGVAKSSITFGSGKISPFVGLTMFESIFHVRFFKEAVSTPKTIIDFLTYLNALHEHIMRLDFPLISLANEIHKINAYPASTNIKIKMSPSLSNLFRYNFFLFAHPLIEGAENDKDFMGIACAALLGEPNSDFVTNLRKFDNLFKDIHLERFTGLLTDTFTGSTQDEGQCLKNLWLNMKRHPAASTSSLSIPLSLVRASSSSSSQAPAPPPRVGVTLEGVLGYPAEPLYSTVQPRSLDVARRVPPPVAPRPDKK